MHACLSCCLLNIQCVICVITLPLIKLLTRIPLTGQKCFLSHFLGAWRNKNHYKFINDFYFCPKNTGEAVGSHSLTNFQQKKNHERSNSHKKHSTQVNHYDGSKRQTMPFTLLWTIVKGPWSVRLVATVSRSLLAVSCPIRTANRLHRYTSRTTTIFPRKRPGTATFTAVISRTSSYTRVFFYFWKQF